MTVQYHMASCAKGGKKALNMTKSLDVLCLVHCHNITLADQLPKIDLD